MDGSNAYIYGPQGTALGTAPVEQISLSAPNSQSSVTYLVSDPEGVRLTFNSSGTITAGATYSAYGNVIAGGLSSITPFGYAGGYTDPTGLIYLVNRYYDPSTGQFLSVDPLVGITDQPYQYAGGDPVNFIDPLGLSWCSWSPVGCGEVQKVTHDTVQAWNDTGGKAVSYVHQHWRGIAQTAIVVGAAVGTGLCVAATDGLCLAATPFIGGLVGTATYSLSGGQHTAGGYAQAFGEGGLVGSLALICATGGCGIAAVAVGIDLTIGASQGIYDYSQSSGCHSFGGYVKAGGIGAFENAPIPFDKLFDGGD